MIAEVVPVVYAQLDRRPDVLFHRGILNWCVDCRRIKKQSGWFTIWKITIYPRWILINEPELSKHSRKFLLNIKISFSLFYLDCKKGKLLDAAFKVYITFRSGRKCQKNARGKARVLGKWFLLYELKWLGFILMVGRRVREMNRNIKNV